MHSKSLIWQIEKNEFEKNIKLLDKQVSKLKYDIEKVREQLIKETKKKTQFKDEVETLKMKQELAMITNRPPIKQVQKSVSKEELEDFPIKPIKQVQKSNSKEELEDIQQKENAKKELAMNSNRPPIIKQVQKSVSKEELEDFPSLKPIKQVQKSISKDKLEDIPQENPNKKTKKNSLEKLQKKF